MKAAYIHQTGSPEVIQVGDLPRPELQPGQVLVQVHRVAVNPIDTYIRSGAVAMQLPAAFVIGCDFAGVVNEVGEGVSGFKVGDRVWGSNQGLLGRQGTFAEYIAVDQEWTHHLPEGVAFEDAAAVALVAITAHLGLFRDAKLKAGETILVIGGTGGVGSMVVQMAKLAGASVITTAGSDAKAAAALALGADHVISYHKEPIGEAVARLVPDGVNVFWETRREPDFDLAVAAMAPRGRMVLMAGRDARPPFPVGPFYVKECSLHGMVMFKASPDEIAQAAKDINQWLATEQLKSNISVRLSLDQAAQSHSMQEAATLHGNSTLAGKIVLSVNEA
ncbi:MAG TPA: quinone oxidoreductase [Planctomycetaceae bacterium]|nr:quinone oxidoreductase [Planctomycetaceae bacterium]